MEETKREYRDARKRTVRRNRGDSSLNSIGRISALRARVNNLPLVMAIMYISTIRLKVKYNMLIKPLPSSPEED